MKKLILAGLLIIANLCTVVVYGQANGAYTVTTTKTGMFANELLKTADQLSDVKELAVEGPLSRNDMTYFSRLLNLEKLDLSQAEISEIGGCNGLTKLTDVKLPSETTQILDNAFSGCSSLSQINLDNIAVIGKESFYNCDSLSILSTPNLISIGSSAFRSCDNLQSIGLDKVREIGESAFSDCGIVSADMPCLEHLGEEVFRWCERLRSVNLGSVITSIPYGSFTYCGMLSDIEIPSSVKEIKDYALEGTSLTSLTIPEGVVSIGSSAISSSRLEYISLPSTIKSMSSDAVYSSALKEITCNIIVPPSQGGIYGDVANVTLYVPAISLSSYKLDESWGRFGSIQPIAGLISDISIHNSFTIYDNIGMADKVNLTLTTVMDEYNSSYVSEAHLSLLSESTLFVGKFVQEQTAALENAHTTLINEGPIIADSVELRLGLESNKWNFISFPFDVNVSDIVMPEGVLWVIRKYSGADRADMTGDTWQNMTESMTLKAHEGYIIHCTDSSQEFWRSDEIIMIVHAVDNDAKNGIFCNDDIEMELQEYPSEYAHNSSWNLIGNPYDAYYNIGDLDFEAPVTLWNGESYMALSPLDDTYLLSPCQAFFVQKPDNAGTIGFSKTNRSHPVRETEYMPRARARATAAEGRAIINIEVEGVGGCDRARLVINNHASATYEKERDAVKFMSMKADVPQIYFYNDGIRYAINECPSSSDGYFLGVYSAGESQYTLGISGNPDCSSVILTDSVTGKTVDLSKETYTFVSAGGYDDTRFKISSGPAISGVDKVVVERTSDDSTVYNLNGIRASENSEGILIVNGKKVLKK